MVAIPNIDVFGCSIMRTTFPIHSMGGVAVEKPILKPKSVSISKFLLE